MKVAVVDIKDILNKDENPTLCLSPLRYTNQCHKCIKFKQYVRRYGSIENAVKHMKCKPHLDEDYLSKLDEIKRLGEKLKELKREIE